MIYWDSFSAFLDMGGRGFYVWGSVLAVLIGLAGELYFLRRQRQEVLRQLAERRMAAED